jgi:hypothetical protein
MAGRNQKDYLKAYYQKNKKKLIIKAKKYREKNKDKILLKNKKYYQKNKKKIYLRNRKWVKINRDKVNEYNRRWKKINLEKVKTSNRSYRIKNRDKLLIKQKKYRKKNTEILRVKSKEYYSKNIEKERKRSKKFRKEQPEKRKISLQKYSQSEKAIRLKPFKIIRGRIVNWAIRHPNYQIKRRDIRALIGERKDVESIVGCSKVFFRKYIEKKFKPGMTWSNHGKWHLDHKIALSKFNPKSLEDIKEANHYSNLQPLWASENLSKKNK